MKVLFRIALFVAAMASFQAASASDYSVSWSVTGVLDGSITGVNYDLDIGTSYISAHGSVSFDNGLDQPSTGTCFITNADGIFCNMSVNAINLIIDIGANLDGTIRIIDIDGSVAEAGVLTLGAVE